MACCDDVIYLNTQSSSQWDGLCKVSNVTAQGYVNLTLVLAVHYANQARQEYYNGISYADAAEARTDKRLGIQGG